MDTRQALLWLGIRLPASGLLLCQASWPGHTWSPVMDSNLSRLRCQQNVALVCRQSAIDGRGSSGRGSTCTYRPALLG
jgi:hypothetical protein